MTGTLPKVAVLGASGLIGEAIASQLLSDGFPITAIARRFTTAQQNRFSTSAVNAPIVSLIPDELAELLSASGADIVVNCVGVLQDSSRGSTNDVHHEFVARLIAALGRLDGPVLLVHLSIPGTAEEDTTSFSRTKRTAEQAIGNSAVPYVVIRPGFVIATPAYGGSALIRALAALPLDLPPRETTTPFSITGISDIAQTVEEIAKQWQLGKRDWQAVWDVMSPEPHTLGDVIEAFRRRLSGTDRRLPIPAWMMGLGAKLGDFASRLGWSPPIRTTALLEMRRGVNGNPGPWIDATGIEPLSLTSALTRSPATVQEKWFSRLYLLKPLVFGSLAVFWCVSGLIALTVAYEAAVSILTAHGFASSTAIAITVASSLTDIAIGLAIAIRKTCRSGLLTGIAVALFYMVSAAVITPEMWIEPLGALVKTVPAIMLIMVALAILEDR